MKEGGLDAEFFAAYVPARYAVNGGAAAYCMKIMETIHEMVDDYPQWVRFADSTSDIEKIVRGMAAHAPIRGRKCVRASIGRPAGCTTTAAARPMGIPAPPAAIPAW